jgi:hypothetical protein
VNDLRADEKIWTKDEPIEVCVQHVSMAYIGGVYKEVGRTNVQERCPKTPGVD